MARNRNDDQCLFLAALIALKYPTFAMLATSWRAGVPCCLAILEALWNSRRRIVRWGDHQCLECWEGLETGGFSFRRAVSRSSDPTSQASRSLGEGPRGAGGI